MAIWDQNDRLVYYNSRYPEHLVSHLRDTLRLGVQFEDWISQGLRAGPVYHAEMGEDFVAQRFGMRRQSISEHEQKLVDGRWLRLRESRLPDGGRVLLTTDVTEQRQASEALAAQTRKLEAVLANMAEGLTIVDHEGRVVLVNEGFMRMYGFGSELARPGTPLAEFVRDRIRRGELDQEEAAALAGADVEHFVARRVSQLLAAPSSTHEEFRPDGRTVLVRRQRLPDGLLVSTYTDVSQLKERDRQLAILATAVEQTGDSVEIATPDYRLVFVNPAFTRLTGWTAPRRSGGRRKSCCEATSTTSRSSARSTSGYAAAGAGRAG